GGEIQLEGSDFSVTANGEVLVEGEEVAKMAIHDFEKDVDGYYQDPDGITSLERKPNGFFMPKPGVQQEPISGDTEVLQGFLEMGNSNTIVQMVDMVELYRTYEADQRAIRAQDETLRRAVNEVGAVR
ncbi:MAG: flagellar basal body rod C-terminal domain-containing protein, partial [Candidatus Latescibacteria bacterium]|nr:flagellar basal body rod C-terminal domain-containing protein [Candidatus Latescibacterota bacterium]